MSDRPIALNVSLRPVSNNKDQRELVAMVAGSLVSFRITLSQIADLGTQCNSIVYAKLAGAKGERA